MGGLGTLPVELLGVITEYICADGIAAAAAKAASTAAIRRANGSSWASEENSDDEAIGDESDHEAMEVMNNESADETDSASEKCSVYDTTRRIRQVSHDLAALASTNRYFHQVFDTVLYQWDHDHDFSHGIAWSIARNSLGTLEKASAMGLLDVNRRVSTGNRAARPILQVEEALRVGSEACLKWLLEHGANPDGLEVEDYPIRVTGYDSPLNQAQVDYDNEEASLLLLEYGAITFFAEHDSFDRSGSSIDDRSSSPDQSNYWETTALHNAANAGHIRVVERLLLEGTIKIDLKDKHGDTPLAEAAARGVDNTAMIELLLRHGADRADPEALCAALKSGHVEHAMLLLCAHKDFTYSFLQRCLETLHSRLTKRDYEDAPGDHISNILSRFVELGADFNYPRISRNCAPEEPLVCMAYKTLDPGIHKALVRLGANPLNQFSHEGKPIDIVADSGARMDVKNPSTGRTIFEAAVDMCDDKSRRATTQYLRHVLEYGNPNLLSASHIYEVLESRLTKMERHFRGCIEIMQHGWISDKAQSHMLDWLISFISGIERPISLVSGMKRPRPWLRSVEEPSKLREMAAVLFPEFLTRQQLDDLWECGLSLLPSEPFRSSRAAWHLVPWWHINAERGDIGAIEILLDSNFKWPPEFGYGSRQDLDLPTPLMRAIAAGHTDLAAVLVQKQILWTRDRFGCSHRATSYNGPRVCCICPYGQESAHDLAFGRGEVELMEVMFTHDLYKSMARGVPNVPRVWSHGNITAEWLAMQRVTRYGLEDYQFLEMQKNMAVHHDGPVPKTKEEMLSHISEQVPKLRAEIIEKRKSWLARAKKLEKETGKTAIFPKQRVEWSRYGFNGCEFY